MDTPNDPAVLDTPADPIVADPIVSDPVVADPAPPGVKNWYDGLNDPDLKENPTVHKYKTNEEQVKAHLELQTLLGHNKVAIPKDENDKIAIENFNKALGIPMSADGYELEPPAAIEGMEHMEFGSDAFKEIAHKHGLTPKQAQGLQGDYMSMLADIKANSEKQYIEKLNETNAALSKEWGLAKEAKIKLAQSVINKFAGSPEAFEHINGAIGADPVALKFLANIGAQFSEGSLGQLGSNPGNFTKTPADAKQEYEAIMNDPSDIYWSGTNDKAPKVTETIRKERITYVESLLKMQLAGNA